MPARALGVARDLAKGLPVPVSLSDTTALLVTAHGTVDALDELPGFLANIRRGRPTPPDVLAEVRRRYEAIGGRSPLGAVTHAQAAALGARLALPARVAMRLWRPYPADVLADLARAGVRRVVSVPIAPYSVHVYHAAVRDAAAPLDVAVVPVEPWNLEPALVAALAAEVARALRAVPATARPVVFFSAHSLPERVVRAGDPYPALVAATTRAVAAAAGLSSSAYRLVYQSQGMSAEGWLGPDLASAFRAARGAGFDHVVVAPVGFLADHIEVLYDLDIEAVALARAEGIALSRTRTLNAAPELIDALEAVVRRALAAT